MEQAQVEKFAAKLAEMEGKQVLKARMDEEGIVILFTDFSKKRFGHGYFSMLAEQKPAKEKLPPSLDEPIKKMAEDFVKTPTKPAKKK